MGDFSFLWGVERAHETHSLIGTYQKIPDCQVETPFLEKAATVVRLGLQRGSVAWPGPSDTVLGLRFSF